MHICTLYCARTHFFCNRLCNPVGLVLIVQNVARCTKSTLLDQFLEYASHRAHIYRTEGEYRKIRPLASWITPAVLVLGTRYSVYVVHRNTSHALHVCCSCVPYITWYENYRPTGMLTLLSWYSSMYQDYYTERKYNKTVPGTRVPGNTVLFILLSFFFVCFSVGLWAYLLFVNTPL